MAKKRSVTSRTGASRTGASRTAASRFAWFGTFKGAIALVASLLGIVGAVLGIVKWFDDRQGPPGTPSFAGSVTHRDSARALVAFLADHDGEIVKLNVTCDARGAQKVCNGDVDPRLASSTEGGRDPTAVLELFTERACPARGERARCPGTYWAVFRVGPTDDQQADNGPFGAGGILAKGTFKSLVRGSLGGVPPGVKVIELAAAG